MNEEKLIFFQMYFLSLNLLILGHLLGYHMTNSIDTENFHKIKI